MLDTTKILRSGRLDLRKRRDALRPFCSKRCADADLLRWLSAGTRAAVEQDDED